MKVVAFWAVVSDIKGNFNQFFFVKNMIVRQVRSQLLHQLLCPENNDTF